MIDRQAVEDTHVKVFQGWGGDYGPDVYLDMLDGCRSRFAAYTAEMTDLRMYGDEVVVAHMTSRDGASAQASGLMVFRVVRGRITEGWAIPTTGAGRHAF